MKHKLIDKHRTCLAALLAAVSAMAVHGEAGAQTISDDEQDVAARIAAKQKARAERAAPTGGISDDERDVTERLARRAGRASLVGAPMPLSDDEREVAARIESRQQLAEQQAAQLPPATGPDRLVDVLTNWGSPNPDRAGDLNRDGVIDGADLDMALGAGTQLDDILFCPTEVGPGQVIIRPDDGGIAGDDGGIAGGGMAGNGWDGPGLGSATVFWHVEGTTPDFVGAGQRNALINAMAAWAGVVDITFQELAVPNRNQQVDWNFLTLDHCAAEAAECGDPDCPFDGPSGVLAHAGFPPGVNSTCINPMPETYAGNVHFDEAETWEQDNAGGSGPFSLTLIACHEVGHGIGLVHDTSGGGDVMRPSFSSNDAFVGLSADDIANVRAGYATGVGSVVTLESTGVWVNGAFVGTELGTVGNPFNTVNEGVNGVPPFSTGVTLHIQVGTYLQTPFIDQAMFIVRNGVGSAIIGGN